LFLGHNFLTTNARKPIKGSKNPIFSLLSIKNMSQKIPSCSWCPESGNLGQKGVNLTHWWHRPQKNKIQNFPIFKHTN